VRKIRQSVFASGTRRGYSIGKSKSLRLRVGSARKSNFGSARRRNVGSTRSEFASSSGAWKNIGDGARARGAGVLSCRRRRRAPAHDSDLLNACITRKSARTEKLPLSADFGALDRVSEDGDDDDDVTRLQ
jgi:hypothetical protein